MAIQHSNACASTLQSCLVAAEGATPLLYANEAEQLIDRIDRELLGLGGSVFSNNNNNAIPQRGSFRRIQQYAIGEGKELYIERLKFLANWSEFIKQEGVTRTQQASSQLAFENAQEAFRSAETRLARLTAGYLIPDPRNGNDGERLAKLELLRYTRLGEYTQRMNAAEETLKAELVRILGYRRATAFVKLAWSNIWNFGFAEPVNPRQGEVDGN